jgi:hypothetical protein
LPQLGLLLSPIALKVNELRSTSAGLASLTLPLTLILVRCDQLVRAPHSHATTVHGDCKMTVQFSHGFFPPKSRLAKTRKVKSRITRVAWTQYSSTFFCLYGFQGLTFLQRFSVHCTRGFKKAEIIRQEQHVKTLVQDLPLLDPCQKPTNYWLRTWNSLHNLHTFLGAFAKLWKATTSFVMSVRPSVRMQQLGSHSADFHKIWHLSFSPKFVENIQVSLTSHTNDRHCTRRPVHIFITSRSFSLKMRYITDKTSQRKSKHSF